MKYLITPDAYAISSAEAIRRGCSPPTIYWWAVIEHPTSGELALELPDDIDIGGTIDALPADWQPQPIPWEQP